MISSATVVLPVEHIEPSAAFFEKIGFTRDSEVPEGDRLGFIIMMNGTVQVMYQTISSIKGDTGHVVKSGQEAPNFLFVIVDDIDSVAAALEGYDIEIPRRETFYGATEIGYKEPGGHIITFAEFKDEA